jgi:hypothetical protein
MTTYQARETPNLPINYFKYPLIDSSNSIDDREANACGYCQADFKVTVQVAHLGCGHIYHARYLSHIVNEVNPLSPDHLVCPTCQAPFKRPEMKFLRKTGAAMARERDYVKSHEVTQQVLNEGLKMRAHLVIIVGSRHILSWDMDKDGNLAINLTLWE